MRRLLRCSSRYPPVLAALACGACSGPQNYMSAAGPAARDLALLGWWVLGVFSLTTLVVWLLLAWIAMRKRGTFATHEPVTLNDGQRWILIGGVAIPLAVLAIIFIATLQTMMDLPLAHAAGTAQIRVVGRQWWFEAEYPSAGAGIAVSSPTEIHIPAGEPVHVALETRDVIHSFWIPKLHGKVDLVPGQTNHMRIQADRPGRYFGQCGEFCGAQHAHMRIEVVAHAPAEFQRWLDRQRQPAANPADEQALLGQRVFMDAACPMCHTIRGTRAGGTIGPDLTHIASRRTIAGGMLANNEANLRAWITHAQSLKPGSRMPSLTQFSGEELSALAAYLNTLE